MDSVISQVAELQKIANDYDDVDILLPPKRNRHAGMAKKLTYHNPS